MHHQSSSSGPIDKFFKPAVLSRQQQEAFDAALLEMIAEDSVPFSIVDRPGFIKFVKVLQPGYRLPSRKTITQHFDLEFDKRITNVCINF